MLLHIVNANIVSTDEVIGSACLAVEDGYITSINSSSTAKGTVIDANGAYLMPGMIDIHSDQVEHSVEPRPGSIIDIPYAVQEQEKQLVNHGITTMYQSLSMWRGAGRAARSDEVRGQLINEIVRPEKSTRLIHQMLHIRFDITNLEAVDRLIDMLDHGTISLLSFMDHTPGQGQYRDLEVMARTMKQNNPSLTDEEVLEAIERRMQQEKVSHERLSEVAVRARSHDISIASHDDDTEEKVDFVRNTLKASISEFPVELSVARYARKLGMATLGGAPNVLMGRSHSGNLSATEGVLDGAISMLCSDYYPPAMLLAVFKLHKDHGIPLPEAVKLTTLAPAEAVGIGDRTGSIEEGKVADILLVDDSNEYPRVIQVFTDGRITSTLNY
jgi:alpha-D-ribose 1-methylphosphonate 5-triphosphate diphosphatase